jgi:membrane fusion protein (multidrug efflux system)
MDRIAFRRALAAASVLATLAGAVGAAAQAPAGPPPSVVVAPVTTADVARSEEYIGTIQAIQSVDLKARVTGFLEAIEFREGSMVEANQVLYEIEKAPYQAELAAAEGQLAAAQASLAGAKAKLTNAQTELDRQLTLVQRGTVSQAVADQAQAARDQAAAEVQSAEATIQQANAQIESAKINLSYTEIPAPIAGQIGATTTTVGNLVGPETGTLATIIQLDPIRVAFSVPEAAYINFVESTGGNAAPDGEALLTPQLSLANRKLYEPIGKLAFTSNRISQQTGSLVIYADFPNPDGVLLPGGFVSVSLQESKKHPMPVVTASAILQDRQGQYVFVLNHENKAVQRRIETGARVGQDYSVTRGLQEGETVIVQGLQKVVPGAEVAPQPQSAAAAGSDSDAVAGAAAGSGSAAAADAPASAGAGAAADSESAATASAADATAGTDAAAAGAPAATAAPATAAGAAAGSESAGTPAAGAPAAGASAAEAPAATTAAAATAVTDTSAEPAAAEAATPTPAAKPAGGRAGAAAAATGN